MKLPARIALLSLAVVLTMGGTTACGPGPRVPASTADLPRGTGWPRTIRDDSGVSVTLKSPPRRIVSLAPSNTEILFALGAGDSVVADTESCDYPPEARRRHHIGGMSAGDLEKIEVEFPDLVVAVGSINQKLVLALRAAHVATLVVEPHTTEQVLSSIRMIGTAVGKDAEAERMTDDMKRRIAAARATTVKATARPKVLIVYSVNPLYTSPPDSFIHDLIGAAGGDDIVQTPLLQNIISPAVVIERAPDVILCGPMLRERLKQLPGWDVVPAVKNSRFFSPSEGAELTRPCPRLAPAVEQLAHYLHPELFNPTGSGKAR